MGVRYAKYRSADNSSGKAERSSTWSIRSRRSSHAPESKSKDIHADVQLTERQKHLLIDSFAELKQNLSQVGVLTFLHLFETHPEVQGFFGNLKDIPLGELPQSKTLRQHALRIMNFVEKCISRLYTPEKMDALIRDLGYHHATYGAPVQYIYLIGPQFILAIKPNLESKWDAETEQAWLTLFTYIAQGMGKCIAEKASSLDMHHGQG